MWNCLYGPKEDKRKHLLVDLRGGECERCGYNKSMNALTFHHHRNKNFTVSSAIRVFTDRQFEEVIIPEVKENCQLLCNNCHREVHESWKKSRPFERGVPIGC
jgi:hypothetical protein